MKHKFLSINRIIFFALASIYSLTYFVLYFIPNALNWHRAVIIFGFFLLLLFSLLSNFKERPKFVRWMTILVLLSIIAQFFLELFDLLETIHTNVVANLFLHVLVPIIYMLFAISLSSETRTRTADRKVSQASFDFNEAMLIGYSLDQDVIEIRLSDSFSSKYQLSETALSLPKEEFRKLLNADELAKANWIDKVLEQSELVNRKYHVRLPHLKKPVAVQIKGSYMLNNRFVMLAIDVTDYEEVEDALISSKNEQADLLQNLPIGVIEQRPLRDNQGNMVDFEIIYVNQAFTQLAGYTKEMLIRHTGSDIIPNDIKNRVKRYARILNTGEMESFEFTIQPINKPFIISAFPTKNDTIISIYQDIHQLKLLNEQLHHLATHDSLTGLYNQRGLFEKIDELKRVKSAICFYISIGNFTELYDYYGVEFTNSLLQQLAASLAPYTNRGIIVANTNSSDLVVILTNPKSTEVDAFFAEIKKGTSLKHEVQGIHVLLKRHIGFAVLGEDATTLRQLITCASLAMSEAASSEHNIIVRYSPTMKQTLAQNINMANKLDAAIANGLIKVAFQKTIDSRDNSVVFIEALARWTDDELGFVSPDTMFSYAKKSNLIDALDDYLLDHTLKTYAELGTTDRLSINISASAFLRPHFSASMKEKAAQYNIDHSKIIIEISENTFVQNINQTIAMIKGYKSDGFPIAIDDFGSQYSSLGILDLFPYDFLKLDGFFANRLDSENIRQVIAGLVKITQRQNIAIVAEKIETTEMAATMQTLGCYIHQGYLYHRPEILKNPNK
ncbi:MAG: EAL domain-containing protein [Methanomicrobia archaeon]|nr:EAL domain-containing protein [Methanomicrobia archaeon]